MALVSCFKTSTVTRLTGLTVRQLDTWEHRGFFVPSIRKSQGSGTRRLYSFEDLVQLRLIAHLRLQGVSLQRLRKAVSFLHKLAEDDKETPPLIFADKNK